MAKKRILVGVLNWGLGHAARCIPLIQNLEKNGFVPIVASDGAALELLRKEFPNVECVALPSYNIEYSKHAFLLRWKLLAQSRKIRKTIKAETRLTQELIQKYQISGIISDNRWGVRHSSVKCVFITHQLQVLSGATSILTSKWHQKMIQKFDECWVPDFPGEFNLSGKLGHDPTFTNCVKYLGPLSRFQKKQVLKKYDCCVMLSGPEPQRTILEKILLQVLENYSGTILFIRGVFSDDKVKSSPQLDIKNHLFGEELETAINQSALIISRSGYTTIMDLAKLEKKAFFIPTPGQWEQQYLAKRLKKMGITPFCQQGEFNLEKLKETKLFSGFHSSFPNTDFTEFFALFQGE